MMSINDVISQLKSLKEVEPNENWVVSVREEILTNAPINDDLDVNFIEKPSKLDNLMYIYESISRKYKFVPSLASMSIVLLVGSFVTVTAAKTSLPGDPLYAVKIANESLMLAVTNDDDKPSVEMEIAGIRLEELTEVSKKASDAGQQQKVEQLVKTFEEKVASANDKMSKISQKSEKKKVARVAKQLNNQTSKYSELLAKTNEGLPSVVKDKVTDQIASALSATEKANMDALLILVESNQQIEEKEISDAEITEIIMKKVEEINENTAIEKSETDAAQLKADETKTEEAPNAEVKLNSADESANVGTSSAETQPVDQKSEIMNTINENLNNNNLVDAVKGIAEVQKLDNKVDIVTTETAPEPVADVNGTAASGEVNATGTETSTPKTENTGKVDSVVTPVPVE